MKKIRRYIFETNSSSSHSLAFSKKNRGYSYELPVDEDGVLTIPFGEFGWGPDVLKTPIDKLSYYVTDNYMDDIDADKDWEDVVEELKEKDWVEKESLIQHMQNFDQKTPHHKFTLWEHCQNVKNQFELLDIRRVAAIWHDVGKIFTQTIDDKGVAHYYSHEHWSTYYVVSHLYLLGAQTTDVVLQILFFINNHMHIRDIINSEKAIKRYKLLWGEDLYNSLIEFMEADNKGAKERFGNAKNI